MDRAEAERDAVELYRRCGCPIPSGIGFRYPHQVSGGQLQRAMTAMAMACKPDLIIFDEPTTALDVTTQIEVLATMKNIVRQFGTAAIYITHDLAVVAQMADRIMVLRYGKLVEEAPTRDDAGDPARGLHQIAVGGALVQAASNGQRPERARCRSSPSTRAIGRLRSNAGAARRLVRDPRAGAPSRWSANPAPASRRLARCITGLLPPKQGPRPLQRRAAAGRPSSSARASSCGASR